MRKLTILFLLAALAFTLSACQGFFEDYSYAPLGATNSSSGSSY
jgi:hypothetical protein